MSWLGVPFTTPEAWAAFQWTQPAFLQQFVDQQNARRSAFQFFAGEYDPYWWHTVGVTMAQPNTIGTGNGAGFNLQTFRRFPLSGNITSNPLPAFGFATAPSVGSNPLDFCMILDGKINPLFLARVNAFLTANGCPAMGASVLDPEDTWGGMPWTRKYGSAAAPTTGYGEPQAGDIIGPWIFNEWWAVLKCMDTILVNPLSTFDGTRYLGIGGYGGIEDPAEAKAAALAQAESEYAEAGIFDEREEAYQVSQIDEFYDPPVFFATASRTRGSYRVTGLNAPGVLAGAKVAHVALKAGGATDDFSEWGDSVPGDEGEVAYLDDISGWDTTPGEVETTPHVPLTPAPTSEWTGGEIEDDPYYWTTGYKLHPVVFVTLDIPDPS